MSGPSRSSVSAIEAIAENLFREPIDYLYADHFRQRVVCKFLDEIALDPAAQDAARLAGIVLAYLEQELPQHIADEEQELFPRLRSRCVPADNAGRILGMLSEEHRQDGDLCEVVSEGLRALAEGHGASQSDGFVRAAAAFAETQRRHLAWEDDVVLPLARERLTNEDLGEMGHNMAKRRGASYPD
jgi:hemerythrin-like domain-containing protein